MKKYLVVGASGLIGSKLIKNICQTDRVYGLCRRPIDYIHENIEWIECDLLKPIPTHLLPSDIDAIIYLAQSQYFRDFPEKIIEIFDVNVVRYLEILNFAFKNKIPRVIYASSGGVYEQSGKSFSEEDRLSLSGELGFYLGSKICGEILSGTLSKVINVQTLRFFFVYGPGQKRNMLMPRLINNIQQGVEIELETNDGIIINPIYVDDAVSALEKVLTISNSETYNIAGDASYTLREICGHIGMITNTEPKFKVKNHISSGQKMCGNITKLKKLGWSPKVDLVTGLKTLL